MMDTLKEQLKVIPDMMKYHIEFQLSRLRPDQNAKLRQAFKWELSPQGSEYWVLVQAIIDHFNSNKDEQKAEEDIISN
jgi:hypothetical protein